MPVSLGSEIIITDRCAPGLRFLWPNDTLKTFRRFWLLGLLANTVNSQSSYQIPALKEEPPVLLALVQVPWQPLGPQA